jgi:hypothetical protein
MSNNRLRFLVVPALVLGALLYAIPRTDSRGPATDTAEIGFTAGAASQVLVEKTYDSFQECDETAKAAAEELKSKGVRAALAARNAMAGKTLYRLYYPDSSTGQITCTGGRLVHEIL